MICIFVCESVFSQRVAVVSQSLVSADRFFGYDTHGFAYFEVNNALIKAKDDQFVEYKSVSLGRISKVDILNPLLIAVYYANFNSVILLDNQLTEISRINFSTLEIPLVVDAVGNASRNKLWIFNELTREIGLFDYVRGNFQSLTQPLVGNIVYYESTFNEFSWVDENNDRFILDVYGKIRTLGTLPAFDEIQFLDASVVVIRKGAQLTQISASGEAIKLLDLDQKTYKSFYFGQQKLAIFTNLGITNYKIITP